MSALPGSSFAAEDASRRIEVAQAAPSEKSWFKTWLGIGESTSEEQCRTLYRNAVRTSDCKQAFEFSEKCREHKLHQAAPTILRLRCAEELVDRRYKALKEDFAAAEKANTCDAMNKIVEAYGRDFDLVDVGEMERANTLAIKLCAEEARKREIAELERQLAEKIRANDCEAFRAFEREKAPKLEAEQATRLATALKQRCDYEEQQAAKLASCLDSAQTGGRFCGPQACYADAISARTGDQAERMKTGEMRKWTDVCSEESRMDSCFRSDPCGGERCSRSLRIAIGSGPLIGFVQQRERSAAAECERKQQAEREEQERVARQKADEDRANSTFNLTLCNKSTRGRIGVAMSYFDYDASDWIVEGWWQIDVGDCIPMGNRFRRGTIYLYASTDRERWIWAGDFGLCINWSKFRRVNKAGVSCNSSRHRKFIEKTIYESEYTQNFVD